MEYISTRNTEKSFSFDDVFIKGLAPDGGLFVPKNIPILPSKEILSLKGSQKKLVFKDKKPGQQELLW